MLPVLTSVKYWHIYVTKMTGFARWQTGLNGVMGEIGEIYAVISIRKLIPQSLAGRLRLYVD